MSLRPLAGAAPPPAACGSLFGPAIGAPADGFWSRLAVSPPRSPPGALVAAPVALPPEFALDAGADVEMADCPFASASSSAATGAGAPASEAPLLESVCPTWAYELGEACLLVFDQEASSTMTVRSAPRRIHNRDPVTIKAVVADALAWKPMRDPATGATGHVFCLSRCGSPVCRIEVNLDGAKGHERLGRVAVVQASYGPLAMASGIADRSSLLVYSDPERHVASLRELRARLGADAELGYAPVAECCVTHNLDRLILRTPAEADRLAAGADAEAARRVWQRTKDFLKGMSTAAADCVDAYADAEIRRTGAHELRGEARAWRRAVA